MKCPLCNTEMRIQKSEYVLNDGALYMKQVLTCRKKDCANFGLEVKTIYSPLSVSEDSEATSEE